MKPLISKQSKIISIILLLFLVIDLSFTFYQNYNLPLDGDLVPIVAPSEHYSQILKDPFGITVIKEQESYAATNRYFSHITMVAYFRNFHSLATPLFKDKVKLLYFISALFNTTTQALLIFILSIYICGHIQFWKFSFLLAAAIIAPFFQMGAFYGSIGIIDKSITYTFFYAVPIGLLFLFYLPFYLSAYHSKPVASYFKNWMWPIWTILSIYICFSGSLMAPLIFIICPSVLMLSLYFKLKKGALKLNLKNTLKSISILSKPMVFFFIFISILSIYSFYIGRFNIENGEPMSLQLRYLKLLKGLPLFFTHKITFALIAIILAINFILLKRSIPNFMKTRVFKVLLLITVLCTVYILLLPFGGYRPYRPIIVRYDTFLPITIVLILLIGISSFQLIMVYLNGRLKVAYAVFLIGILAIFMISDFNELPNNECQKAALYEIKSSKKKIVKLQNNCTVLSWFIMPDQNYTSDIGKMLHYWDISQTEILFYQEVN